MPKLPMHVLRMRLKNELEACKREFKHHEIVAEDPEFTKFPTRIYVTLKNVPGPVLKDGKVTLVMQHKFVMIITDEYPYRKPIVQWLTDIFHPNITKPEDGGHFCSGLLKNESFNFSLVSFIKSVEALLMNPNPYSPWDTDSCMAAAKYFHQKNVKEKRSTSQVRIQPTVPLQTPQMSPQSQGYVQPPGQQIPQQPQQQRYPPGYIPQRQYPQQYPPYQQQYPPQYRQQYPPQQYPQYQQQYQQKQKKEEEEK